MNDGKSRTILGRYRVLRELGSGSFGTTWAAEDLETGEQVAVKGLDLSRVDDWKAVELFEREANVLKQLDHPNIPRYLDFVPVEAAETGYLIQSLAPGHSLDKLLAEHGRFSDDQVESIAERMLEILVYLESLNPAVVHRDIKPSNIVSGDDGSVYLVDFGAVQDAAKRSAEGGSTVAGTFGYMAPEQLHGTGSPRSDQHALGMTLVHLASGRHPSQMNRRGLSLEFKDELDLPEAFESFIERLVEPNPEDRFPSADAALKALRSEVEPPPTYAALPSGPSIVETVLARERAEFEAARAADRRRSEAIEARRAKIARRPNRVTVAIGDGDCHIEVRPPRTGPALVAAGSALFAFVNPGFAIAGGYPFFGRYWPVFADNWQARWGIWAVVCFVIAALWVRWATAPRRLRLSSHGFFAAYHRNPDNLDHAGRFESLSVKLFDKDEDQVYPPEIALLTLTDADETVVFQERFESLSQADVELLGNLSDDWKSRTTAQNEGEGLDLESDGQRLNEVEVAEFESVTRDP